MALPCCCCCCGIGCPPLEWKLPTRIGSPGPAGLGPPTLPCALPAWLKFATLLALLCQLVWDCPPPGPGPPPARPLALAADGGVVEPARDRWFAAGSPYG